MIIKFGMRIFLSFIVGRTTNTLEVLEQASCMIRTKFGITETTIQVEEHVPDMLDCTHCRDLPD